jgi:uncharacterized protein (TIGR03435 family)
VVSVRRTKGDPQRGGIGDTPDGFSMADLPLESAVMGAYGIERQELVKGLPGWAMSVRFDIEAKMDEETADALRKLPKQEQDAQRQLMLQALLGDRFKLKVHRGTEIDSSYELTVAKGGSRMKEDNVPESVDGSKSQEGERHSTDWMISDGKISGHAMPVSILAGHLPAWVGGPIVDKTGLTGSYDVLLQWDPNVVPDPNSNVPGLFAALEEQLGLHLKPTKTTVDTIVIDRLERPSEN